MRRRPRYVLILVSLVAAAVLAAGGSGTWSAFSATSSTGSGAISSAADWTGPTATASVIAHSSKGAGVKAGGTTRTGHCTSVSRSRRKPVGACGGCCAVINGLSPRSNTRS